jgi:uncharacterized membrane protein
MHPALRIVLAVVGAAFGANLAGEGARLLAAVVGALAGLAAGEVVSTRSSLERLHAELRELRRRLNERQATPVAVAQPQGSVTSATPPPPRVAPQAPAPRPVVEPAPPRANVPRPPTVPNSNIRGDDRGSYTPRENPVIKILREYFTGGNTLVRAGVVVLFFGVAFLLRYLAEHTHIPIEFRLSGVALGAFVLLVLGWRLRVRRPGYALALQGGAIGILYLTVFSALHLYSVLTPGLAFVLLAVISALSGTLAVQQSSLAVALLSATGGFLAPFIASTGHGDHVALFSYFAVLNLAILGIAWFRSWRPLNVAGFVFTFVLSTTWGVLQYQPQDFASSEPFLIFFFLLYVAIAVLYSTRQAPTLHGYLDGTIIFGTPIAAFGLQAAMLHDQPLALAYSALALSALYIALAWLLHTRKGERQRLLVEAFMALGVAFLTLALPLALNGRWSAASWALEGTALIWVGCRQNRPLPRGFGALLQLAAGASLALTSLWGTAVPSGTYIAALMVGVASACAAQILHANKEKLADYEATFAGGLFLWGLLWWCIGGVNEIEQHVAKSYLLASTQGFATVTALLCAALARRFRLTIALLPALSLLPVMALFALWAAGTLTHPLAQAGWICWPVSFAALYAILWLHDEALVRSAMSTLHACTLWLLTALLSWEAAWAIDRAVAHAGAWSIVVWGVLPAAVLAVLPPATARMRWPLQLHRTAYLVVASCGFALYLSIWSVVTNVLVSSPSAPLPYVPVFNPLDIAQALVLFVLIRAWLRLRAEPRATLSTMDQRPVVVLLSLVAFFWLNAVLLRTLHQWVGIPYEIEAMMKSTLVQSALSIFWAFVALTTMLVATRVTVRILWLTGAALLVVVVLKLFLVDLSSIGTVERIVSFVGVGLLMLVLGYFSPLPPAARTTT